MGPQRMDDGCHITAEWCDKGDLFFADWMGKPEHRGVQRLSVQQQLHAVHA